MNLVFNENLRDVLGDLAKVDAGIEQIRELCRPVLNGEHYLSGGGGMQGVTNNKAHLAAVS